MEDKIPDLISQIIEEDEILKEREKDLSREAFSFLSEENLDPQKAQEILESRPSSKIAKILAEIIYKKVPTENLKEILQNELEITENRAMEIENKIKERILKQMATFSSADQTPLKKELPKTAPSRNYDPYREPIEEEIKFSLSNQDLIGLPKEEVEKEIKKEYKSLVEGITPEEEFYREGEKTLEKETFPEIRIQKREKKFSRSEEEKKESYFRTRKIDPYREIPE